jgi:hypothetical protein
MKNANHRQEKVMYLHTHTNNNKETQQLCPSAEDYGQTQAVKEGLTPSIYLAFLEHM